MNVSAPLFMHQFPSFIKTLNMYETVKEGSGVVCLYFALQVSIAESKSLFLNNMSALSATNNSELPWC